MPSQLIALIDPVAGNDVPLAVSQTQKKWSTPLQRGYTNRISSSRTNHCIVVEVNAERP